jgi:3-dehydroquinate dehydratase-2
MSTSPTRQQKRILLLNGPNLNLLGTREPHIYGHTSLSQVEADAQTTAATHNASLITYQSNHEGALIDRIQAARTEGIDGIIINPGAFTHTSVAIRDALLGVDIPFVELHVSNIHARPEEWRHRSYFSDKARAVIMGCGVYGYKVAVEFVAVNFPVREGR